MKFIPSQLAAMSLLGWAASAECSEIRFCINESSTFYFHNKAGTENSERPGLLIDFIHDLEKKLGLKVKIVRRTQRGCQTLIESNAMDAYGIISYEAGRAQGYAYPPLKAGVPDKQYAFNTAGYALYSNAASSFHWNGESIADLAKWKLGGIESNSVVNRLRSEGVNVQTFKSVAAMLKRLQNKELDAIAVHGNQVDRLSDKLGLKKHEKLLYVKDYFIVFSAKFHETQQEMARKIWTFSSQYMNSAEGKQALQKYDEIENF